MAPSIADVVAQDALYHKTRTLLDLLTLKNKVTVLTGKTRCYLGVQSVQDG